VLEAVDPDMQFLLDGAKERNTMLLHSNTFRRNVALFDANAVNYRKTVPALDDVFSKSFEDRHAVMCGGFTARQNHFADSVGCARANGAMMLYCSGPPPADGDERVQYQERVDSQYFAAFETSDHIEELLLQTP
jgi:hypothetical protein